MNSMVQTILRHRVFVVYVLSLLWLATGMFIFGLDSPRGLGTFYQVVAVIAGVVLVYGAVWTALRSVWPGIGSTVQASGVEAVGAIPRLLSVFVAGYVSVVVIHFLVIGFVPLVEALKSNSDIGVSIVRQKGYFDLPVYLRYLSDYSIKALGPALLLFTYYFRSRLFWVVLAVGSFYSVALIARILPIIFFAPFAVYVLSQRRWGHLVLAIGAIALQVGFITSVGSIAIRESIGPMNSVEVDSSGAEGYKSKKEAPPADDWRRTSIAYALYERALIVPAQVIDQWFYFYSQDNRREHGCGYRPLARVLGCAYVPVPTKLYAAYHPDNVRQGMNGSLNAASFMTEFANFGSLGFLLSCLMSGILFACVTAIYGSHPLALPLNLPLIFVAMESSLLTAVNSGAGWIAMTALFVLFFRWRKRS